MKHHNFVAMNFRRFQVEFRANQSQVINLMAPNQHSIVMNCVIDSIRCDSFPLAKTNPLIALKERKNLIVVLEFRNFSTFFYLFHHFHLVNASANCKESNSSIGL